MHAMIDRGVCLHESMVVFAFCMLLTQAQNYLKKF